MRKLSDFEINFSGLKNGQHKYNYIIDKTFFEFFNYNEFIDSSYKSILILDKKTSLIDFKFFSHGYVTLNCDVTNEPFNLNTSSNLEFIVKFGNEYNDDNDEIIFLPHGSSRINVSQYIYEMIVLSIPLKRVNPEIKIDKNINLENLKSNKSIVNNDPRWNELKKLL
tara:strand:+ start:1243 stop:1743 length:501 start_codon:yes stop_codon:yes gene_type:complete